MRHSRQLVRLGVATLRGGVIQRRFLRLLPVVTAGAVPRTVAALAIPAAPAVAATSAAPRLSHVPHLHEATDALDHDRRQAPCGHRASGPDVSDA
jgi:hypothetical protein